MIYEKQRVLRVAHSHITSFEIGRSTASRMAKFLILSRGARSLQHFQLHLKYEKLTQNVLPFGKKKNHKELYFSCLCLGMGNAVSVTYTHS